MRKRGNRCLPPSAGVITHPSQVPGTYSRYRGHLVIGEMRSRRRPGRPKGIRPKEKPGKIINVGQAPSSSIVIVSKDRSGNLQARTIKAGTPRADKTIRPNTKRP